MIIINYDKKFKIVTDYFKIGALSLQDEAIYYRKCVIRKYETKPLE